MTDATAKHIAIVAAKAALEKKAINVRLVRAASESSITDFFLLCDGINDKQIRAIADEIEDTVKEEGHAPLFKEGYNTAKWIVLDYGNIIIHIMDDELRMYYKLDELWPDTVEMEIDDGQ